MKIWCRTSKTFLSHGRTSNGGSISYDEMINAFSRLGIECVPEYPAGNVVNAVRYEPPDSAHYLHLWCGDPTAWQVDDAQRTRGNVAYCRCGEAKLPGKQNLEKCEYVLVGTESLRAFHQSYLVAPVGIMFGGYEAALFPQRDIDFSASPFVFLHAGATQWRKGSDKACAAFTQAFPDEQDVRLIIRSPGASPMFQELRDCYAGDARIVFDDKVVTDRRRMQQEYYADGHCLVYPSIIEGVGRCLSEGMATGMPCIVSRTSSMVDYFNEGFGWWIETVPHPHGHKDPDVESMAQKMRIAYENRDECRIKGNAAARFAAEELTWEAGIPTGLPILEAIYNTRTLAEVASSLPPPIKLNVGCDLLTIDGYVNVDIRARRNNARLMDGKRTQYFCDIRKPIALAENTVEAITMSHVLFEDIQEEQFVAFLHECYRILKTGGIFRITDLDSEVFYFPSLFEITPARVLGFLSQAGFRAERVNASHTNYTSKDICLDMHGGEPRCFFAEGIKDAGS